MRSFLAQKKPEKKVSYKKEWRNGALSRTLALISQS